MKTKVVAIGNSKGVRIPAAVLELIDANEVGTELEIKVQGKQMTITRKVNTKEGWEEAFKRLAAEDTEDWSDWLDAPLTHDSELEPWE